MKCKECNAEIEEFYNFCKHCGAPLDEEDFSADQRIAVRKQRSSAAGMLSAVFLLFLAVIATAVFLVYRMSVKAADSTEGGSSAAALETLPPITETTTQTTVTELTTTAAETTTTAAAATKPAAGTVALPEDVLRRIVAAEGNIALWQYADYDGDGLFEAFALTTVGETFFSHTIESLYFIDAYGKMTKLYDPTAQSYDESRDGCYRVCGGRGFFWFDYSGLTMRTKTMVYSVADGKPYRLEICDELRGFYQDEAGRFYTVNTDFSFSGGFRSVSYELIYEPERGEFRMGGVLDTSVPDEPLPETGTSEDAWGDSWGEPAFGAPDVPSPGRFD